MIFADTLKQHSIDTWQKILSHRFVMELSSEILPVDKFVFYLRQDHYFLEEFEFLHPAKQKANDNKLKEWLDGFTNDNGKVSLSVHMLLEEVLL